MTDTLKVDKTFTRPVNWITTSFMLAFHIGAVAALFMLGWKPFLVAFVLWWVAGSLAIGLCPRSSQRQVSLLDQRVALGSSDGARHSAPFDRRIAVLVVGHLL